MAKPALLTLPLKRPRVLVDADVLFAGSASSSEHGASLVLLRLAEISLIEAIAPQQVITEVERNLTRKMPTALPAFRLLVSRCLRVCPDPAPNEVAALIGCADEKDLPILVAAVQEECPWLATFNGRHFQPGHPQVAVLTPGDFIQRVRHLLTALS